VLRVTSVNKPDTELAARFIQWLIEEKLRQDPEFFRRAPSAKR
jgi:hypothetical protein